MEVMNMVETHRETAIALLIALALIGVVAFLV
jgi:hypothetical protein